MMVQALITLRRARKLFDAYLAAVKTGKVVGSDLLAAEIHVLLRNVDWVLSRLHLLHSEYLTLDAQVEGEQLELSGGAGPVMSRMFSMNDEVQFFAEAFYLFSWRLREAVRHLPSCGDFDPVGVRELRGKMLEHPERRGGVLRRSLSYGGETGPQLHENRGLEGQRLFDDPGLFPNAQELQEKLEAAFEGLLKAGGGETPGHQDS
jgi:hypothetical protein